MSTLKKTTAILFLSALVWHLSLINISFAQENPLYDPLNLYHKPEQKTGNKNTYIPRAIITSISAEKRTNSITIKALPEINYKISITGKLATIEILNANLHKSISNKNYNWNAKIKNILPTVYLAEVDNNYNNKSVLVNIKFEYPLSVSVIRNGPTNITFNFEKNEENLAVASQSMGINTQSSKFDLSNIETIGTVIGSNDIRMKPSGKYLTVGSNNKSPFIVNKRQDAPTLSSNSVTTNANSNNPKTFSPTSNNDIKLPTENEENITNIPSDLPLPNPPLLDNETGNPLPGNYNRSDNAFADQPQDLPELERPESTKNELLKKQDYNDIMRIGISLESENKLEDSIHKYSQAISIDPNRYEAYSAKGDVLLKQDKFDEAIENYNLSLNIKEDQVKTIFNLAIAYKKIQQHKEAITSFEKVLEYQPENYESLYNLANLNFIIKDYADAIKYYNKCIDLTKKSQNTLELARVYYNLANTYKEMEDFDNAINEYIKSIKLFKEFPDAHYNLAATYLEKGKKGKAIEEFEEFIKYTSSTDEIKRVRMIIEQLTQG